MAVCKEPQAREAAVLKEQEAQEAAVKERQAREAAVFWGLVEGSSGLGGNLPKYPGAR